MDALGGPGQLFFSPVETPGGYLEHLPPSAHIYPGQLHLSSKLLSYVHAFLTCPEDQGK